MPHTGGMNGAHPLYPRKKPGITSLMIMLWFVATMALSAFTSAVVSHGNDHHGDHHHGHRGHHVMRQDHQGDMP